MTTGTGPGRGPDRGSDRGRLHVLRLASVFEPEAVAFDAGAARFDPIGGMQNHTATLSRCLDERGVRQTVLTSRLAARAGVQRLGSHTVVRRVGVRMSRLRQLWAICAAPYALGARGVDLVHAHQGEDVATLLLGMAAAARHRCPLVVTLHCSVRHTFTGQGPKARVLRLLGGAVEAAALRRSAAVLVLVPRTARMVVADGVPADRVHVVPSGFDPRLFAAPGPFPMPAGPRPRVGYVGRLAAQKAPQLLVEAFGEVTSQASLVVVGDGPLRPVVEAAIAASPARDRIALHGFVPHEQVAAVLAGLDLLVLPSVYEEMGSVLVEAMASGLPVVATRVGGIPEVVADGETGVLVEPGDVRELAEVVDKLLANPAELERLAEGARIRSEWYSWPGLAARVESVYATVTGPGR